MQIGGLGLKLCSFLIQEKTLALDFAYFATKVLQLGIGDILFMNMCHLDYSFQTNPVRSVKILLNYPSREVQASNAIRYTLVVLGSVSPPYT